MLTNISRNKIKHEFDIYQARLRLRTVDHYGIMTFNVTYFCLLCRNIVHGVEVAQNRPNWKPRSHRGINGTTP